MDPRLKDESIKDINYFEYTPQTQANNNNPNHQIKRDINVQHMYDMFDDFKKK